MSSASRRDPNSLHVESAVNQNSDASYGALDSEPSEEDRRLLQQSSTAYCCRTRFRRRVTAFLVVVICAGVLAGSILLALYTSGRGSNNDPFKIPLYVAHNGNIHTVDSQIPLATSFVVSKAGTFLEVSASDLTLRDKYYDLPRLDLEGRTVIPGIGDGHAHLTSLGLSMKEPDLGTAKSAADVVQIMLAFCEKEGLDPKVDAGRFITARGWDQTTWASGADTPFPTAKDLDAAFPGLALVLDRVDGHAIWTNTAAMEIVGPIPPGDPPGGHVIRDDEGNPTGVFVDDAAEYFYNSSYSDIPEEKLIEAAEIAVARCSELGVTHMHDASMEEEDFVVYQKLLAKGRQGSAVLSNATGHRVPRVKDAFPLRVHGLLSVRESCPPPSYKCPDGFPTTKDSDAVDISEADATANDNAMSRLVKSKSTVQDLALPLAIRNRPGRIAARAVKMFMDGALGSWGAAMLEPYTDKPTESGLTKYTMEELKTAAASLVKQGFQVCTHAIGDKANRMVLDAYESVIEADERANGLGREARHRIEHLQIVNMTDMPRLRALGVLPSMQPTHGTSDMNFAELRLGPARLAGAYAWKSALESGGFMPLGTDFPVEKPLPMRTFHAGTTRQNEQGQPEGGWLPSERLSRQEVLAGMTWHVAYGSFNENKFGRIKGGFLADFVVLDRDILTIPDSDILKATVLATFIDGNAVYLKSEAPPSQLALESSSPSSAAASSPPNPEDQAFKEQSAAIGRVYTAMEAGHNSHVAFREQERAANVNRHRTQRVLLGTRPGANAAAASGAGDAPLDLRPPCEHPNIALSQRMRKRYHRILADRKAQALANAQVQISTLP